MPESAQFRDLPRLDDYFSSDADSPTDLMGTLRTRRAPGATRVTVKSRKLKNCVLNWKKFLFDVLPVSVGAATVIPSSVAAAAIVGMQAVKAAIDSLDIELPDEASEVVLRLAALQRTGENDGGTGWISLDSVRGSLGSDAERNRLDVVLRDLERLAVLRFDHTETQVRIVEEIRFEETT